MPISYFSQITVLSAHAPFPVSFWTKTSYEPYKRSFPIYSTTPSLFGTGAVSLRAQKCCFRCSCQTMTFVQGKRCLLPRRFLWENTALNGWSKTGRSVSVLSISRNTAASASVPTKPLSYHCLSRHVVSFACDCTTACVPPTALLRSATVLFLPENRLSGKILLVARAGPLLQCDRMAETDNLFLSIGKP